VAISARSAHQMGQVVERNEVTTECTQAILTQTVTALNERTAYSDRTAAAQQRVRDALAAVVAASLKKDPPSQSKARELVAELAEALRQANKLTDRAAEKRDSYPYPTVEAIRNCPPKAD